MGAERSLRVAVLALALQSTPADALVGDAREAPGSVPLVTILTSGSGASGFCSGIAVAPDVVLTAAHCVRDVASTRVRPVGSDPLRSPILPIAEIVVHPEYRADAARRRVRSIDLALLHLPADLPAGLSPVSLAASDEAGEPGEQVQLAGYGLSRENDARTGGTLRVGDGRVRAPASAVLLWLSGPTYACTGDSGGAVLEPRSGSLIGVIAWASGASGRQCGDLTQAIRISAARRWIDEHLARWRR